MIGSKVLIRSFGSGVHFGTLENENFTAAGKVVTLSNSSIGREVYCERFTKAGPALAGGGNLAAH